MAGVVGSVGLGMAGLGTDLRGVSTQTQEANSMSDKTLWGMCQAHKTANDAYRDGWDRIFGKAEAEAKGNIADSEGKPCPFSFVDGPKSPKHSG